MRQSYKKYEKEIKAAVSKRDYERTEYDYKVLEILTETEEYLEIYDKTENKDMLKLFKAIFLRSKNRSKTLVALAGEFSFSTRSIKRYKKKILGIYACIYARRESDGKLSLSVEKSRI